MANRHLSRSIILQSLFEWDFGVKSVAEVKKIFARNAEEFASNHGDFAFMDNLLKGVLDKRKDIDLSKTFGGETSSKFVNGVLGAVYKELGQPGKVETSRDRRNKSPNTGQVLVE